MSRDRLCKYTLPAVSNLHRLIHQGWLCTPAPMLSLPWYCETKQHGVVQSCHPAGKENIDTHQSPWTCTWIHITLDVYMNTHHLGRVHGHTSPWTCTWTHITLDVYVDTHQSPWTCTWTHINHLGRVQGYTCKLLSCRSNFFTLKIKN